jgi:hypothetical protein
MSEVAEPVNHDRKPDNHFLPAECEELPDIDTFIGNFETLAVDPKEIINPLPKEMTEEELDKEIEKYPPIMPDIFKEWNRAVSSGTLLSIDKPKETLPP